MSGTAGPDLRNLDDCGCCAGLSGQTPAEIANRPGLSAIAYRAGTHAQFLQSMLAGLSSAKLPALAGLRTRDRNDFSFALLDAWATVADVLTFYQERIANESYLRTATERRSLLELARLIGYDLRPGVAASTCLAFTLEDAPGSPRRTTIDAGAKVQSVPGQNEMAQTFETIEPLDARVEWNAMRAQESRLVWPQPGQARIYLKGTTTDLKPGDGLLIVGFGTRIAGFKGAEGAQDGTWELRRVANVEVDSKKERTLVTLEPTPASSGHLHDPLAKQQPRIYAMRQRASIFGHNAPEWPTLQDSIKRSFLGLLESASIPESDLVEWPNFKVFAPEQPLVRPGGAAQPIWMPPTVAWIAEATVAAAYEAATATAGRAAAAAAKSALLAADVAQAAADTASTAASAIVEVAKSAALGAQQEAKNAIDIMLSTLTGVQNAIAESTTAAVKKVERGVKKAVESGDPGAAIGGMSDAVSQGTEGAARAVLERVKPEIDRLVAPVVAAAGAAALAATGPAAALATLSARTSSFFQMAEKAAIDTFATAAATAAATSVIAVIKAIAADPDATVEGIEEAATQAAENAPEAAGLTAAAALSDPRMLVLAPVIIQGAKRAGKDIRDAVLEALKKELQGRKQNVPARTPWKKLTEHTIDLDAVYSKIVRGSWVVLSLPNLQALLAVEEASEISRADFLLSAKVTRLKLTGENWKGFNDHVRATLVSAQSEELALAEEPIPGPISGDVISLQEPVEGLTAGQLLAVSGREFDSDQPLSEVVTLRAAEPVGKATQLFLTTSLDHRYRRDTVVVSANVARATHGETVREVLGSGDASQPFQRFALKHAPLTFVSAVSASGAASTLRVYVNDLEWHEAPTLHGLGPQDRAFITRTGDNDQTTVQFGDGQTGARLPTGQENVRVVYRKGIGLDGLVKTDQLSLLLTRPLGVRSVTNPEAATGGADRESLADARTNATLTVLALDRAVSLQDYEDFARAFAGIAKALATWTGVGRTRGVLLTVAGPSGVSIDPQSVLYANLLAALAQSGDANISFRVVPHRDARFQIRGTFRVERDHLPEKVRAAVEAALVAHFSFAARSFGQPVTLSEVVSVIQGTPGVQVVDVDELSRTTGGGMVRGRLLAAMPEGELGAELLTLDAARLNQLQVLP